MRIFQVNDCDWWMAESAEQARNSAIEAYGGDDDDCVLPLEEIEEVSATEMERLKFHDEDEEETRTFKEQLAKRIREGAAKPEIFASTEY